jgi:class 3 adenylate cyclase/tetratricopeptide (TPR) repeat protein
MAEADSNLLPAGGRRYVTVLFSDMSDSTALGAQLEAEYLAELMVRLRTLCREIIPRHGGHIARIQGDGVLAIFGLGDSSAGDAGRRAAEAALELHSAVGRMDLRGVGEIQAALAMHTGIHGGLALVSDGDIERGRIDVLGQAPNIAARLSDEAGRHEILVSEETLGPDRHFFVTGEPRELRLKGRAEPLSAVAVLARSAIVSRFEARTLRVLSPFVGREAQLGALHAALQTARAGHKQTVVVQAGPGMGKSRLIEEFLRSLDRSGTLVLRGHCETALSAQPLQPLRQILRSALGITPEQNAATAAQTAAQSLARLQALDDPARADIVAAVAGEAAESGAGGAKPTGALTATRRALQALLQALTKDHTFVVTIDDWQWADDATRQALDAVLRLELPMLTLLSTRPAEGESSCHGVDRTLSLPPLALDVSIALARNLAPATDPFGLAEVERHAGGNPLFIEELCHAMASRTARGPVEQPRSAEAWLSALIEARVNRLPEAAARVVRTAAVIGNVIPHWLLARVAGAADDTALIADLEREDFIFSAEHPGMLRFKHGITRDVIYEAVGLHERHQLHGAIADVLAASDDGASGGELWETLAYHHAGAGQPAQAARYAELAGDKAMAAQALDRARVQYSAALAALDRLRNLSPEDRLSWCRVAQKLGMAMVFDPLALSDGVSVFERGVAVARETGSAEALARAEYWLGYMHYALGRARDATLHCNQALALGESAGDHRLAAQVRATLGQVHQTAARYDEALPLLAGALDSKRATARPGSGVAVGSAYTLACMGAILGDRGQFEQAHACFDEALALLGDSMHGVVNSVRNWIGLVHMWQGRWDEAVAMQAASMRVAEHVKSRQLLAVSRTLWGYAQWMAQGEVDGLKALRDATAWIDARQGGLVTSLNHGFIVDAAVAQNRPLELRRHAARLFRRARANDLLGAAMGCRALARDAAERGDFTRAERYLALALRAGQARGSPHEQACTGLCRAGVEHLRGRTAEARAALDAAGEAFERLHMAWHLAQATLLRSRL